MGKYEKDTAEDRANDRCSFATEDNFCTLPFMVKSWRYKKINGCINFLSWFGVCSYYYCVPKTSIPFLKIKPFQWVYPKNGDPGYFKQLTHI